MTKFLFLLTLASTALLSAQTGKVGINTESPQGALDVVSADSGLIPPRVANTAAVTVPVNGMVIYDNSRSCIKIFQSSEWSSCMGSAGGDSSSMVSDYKLSARNTDHSGWLKCDGRAVSRTDYAELFAIIDTSFGAGDGATTFNLPNFTGKVAGAVGQGVGLTNRVLGANVGNEKHTLTQAELPNYTITTAATSAGTPSGTLTNSGSHTHTVTGDTASKIEGTTSTTGDAVLNNGDGKPYVVNTGSAGNHTHTFTGSQMGTHVHTLSTGGSDIAHNNMQPTLFAGNYFIYAGN